MYDLRANDASALRPRPPQHHLVHAGHLNPRIVEASRLYVTPNVNVIYGFGFLDLRHEPIILSAPASAGLYYMVEIVNMWTNAFAYVGGKTQDTKAAGSPGRPRLDRLVACGRDADRQPDTLDTHSAARAYL